MNDRQIATLRGAFAASVKDCTRYKQNHPHLWKEILRGDLLDTRFNLLCVLGDYFAFWYTELRGKPEEYHNVAKMFFEVLYQPNPDT